MEVPSTLTLQSRVEPALGLNLLFRPSAKVAAIGQVTLMATPADKTVQPAALRTLLQETLGDAVAGSVEKTFAPEPVKGVQAEGWLVRLTDASLVGKPPVPDNYKRMCSAALALDLHTLVIVTLQYDDADTPAARDLVALLTSLKFVPNPSPLHKEGAGYVFTVPESRLRLVIPSEGFEPQSGGADRPPGTSCSIGTEAASCSAAGSSPPRATKD